MIKLELGDRGRSYQLPMLDKKFQKWEQNLPDYVLAAREIPVANPERPTSAQNVVTESKAIVDAIMTSLKQVRQRDKLVIPKNRINQFVTQIHAQMGHDGDRALK